MNLNLARLVYLLAANQITLPKELRRFLDGGDWLSELYLGLSAGAQTAGAPLEHLQDLYLQGQSLGKGSREEAFRIIGEAIDNALKDQEIPIAEKLKVYEIISRCIRQDPILEEGIVKLSSSFNGTGRVTKWDTGFTPLDMAVQGLYQGLLVLMGKPGSGKTSLMISIIESLIKGHPELSILFVQNEIPKDLMLARIGVLKGRAEFKPQDLLVCGSWSGKEILSYVQEHPDPNRVVIFDGPDVVSGQGGADNRRFVLEETYQDLIRVKQTSRLVICSSQARRQDRILELGSVAESWAKAWYADMLIGIQPAGGVGGFAQRVRLKTLKNRFGPPNGSVLFRYDYADLSWSLLADRGGDDVWEE